MKSFLIFLISISIANAVGAQDCAAILTDTLTKHFEKSNLPGFAVAIIRENGIVYQKGFGYANKRTKKPFELTTMEKIER